jgi:hypothetical protein
MTTPRRTRAAFPCALVLLALAARWTAPAQAARLPAPNARQAFLVRGADPIKGLPFFPPNAISALTGASRPEAREGGAADRSAEIIVWYTNETLVLGSSWKRADFPGHDVLAFDRTQGPVLVLKGASYYLFFELPAGAASNDPRHRAFILAFDRKFQVLVGNAATQSDLSFPAYVDY